MKNNDGMEALKELMSISNIMDLKHPNLINLCGRIEKALQPIATNEEVEEVLERLEYIGDKDLYNGVHIQIKNTLKTKFQQMQQEIENRNEFEIELRKMIIERENKLKKYKQLLDKIDLEELGVNDGWGNWYPLKEMEPPSIYNILKELKSLGGNNGSTL